jgi:hypothetical protein
MPTAPKPGGVAIATIVSAGKSDGPDGSALEKSLGRGPQRLAAAFSILSVIYHCCAMDRRLLTTQ